MRDPQAIADPALHVPAIDGLRGIAVLMVLAVHTSQRVSNVGLEAFHFSLIGEFVNAGARGVELFFLLSAFTLFRSSKAKYSEECNPRRNFYIRRAFRILPLWWMAVTLYALWGAEVLARVCQTICCVLDLSGIFLALRCSRLGGRFLSKKRFICSCPLSLGLS